MCGHRFGFFGLPVCFRIDCIGFIGLYTAYTDDISVVIILIESELTGDATTCARNFNVR